MQPGLRPASAPADFQQTGNVEAPVKTSFLLLTEPLPQDNGHWVNYHFICWWTGTCIFFPWSFEHHIKMILVHKYLHPHTDDGSPSKHSFCGDACTNRISLVLSPKLRLPKVQMRALEWKNDWVGSYKACWNMGQHDLPWVACAFARSCSAG